MTGSTLTMHSSDDSTKNLPELRHMVISINRHRKKGSKSPWNSQIPLYLCQPTPGNWDVDLELQSLEFHALKQVVYQELNVHCDDSGLCVVWRICGSGQLGRVYDDESFQAAVLDHYYAEKRVVELFVVRADDVCNLPEYFPK